MSIKYEIYDDCANLLFSPPSKKIAKKALKELKERGHDCKIVVCTEYQGIYTETDLEDLEAPHPRVPEYKEYGEDMTMGDIEYTRLCSKED